MARKCTYKKCRSELPVLSKSDTWQSKGFCNVECMADHGLAKAREQAERKRKADEAGIKKRNKSFKKKVELGDIKKQKDLTQSEFNKWIKLEELYRCAIAGDQPVCISCSKPWTPFINYDFAAGHYHSRGSRQDLALNSNNVYLQCNGYCNSGLSANKTGEGKTHGYLVGLQMRFGVKEAGFILEKLIPVRNFTYTGTDYERCRKWLAGRNRQLRKDLELFTDINQE